MLQLWGGRRMFCSYWLLYFTVFSSLNILKNFNSAATPIIYRSLSHNIKGFEAKIKMLIMWGKFEYMKNQLRKDVSCVFVCVVVAGWSSSCQSCVGVFFCLDVCVWWPVSVRVSGAWSYNILMNTAPAERPPGLYKPTWPLAYTHTHTHRVFLSGEWRK